MEKYQTNHMSLITFQAEEEKEEEPEKDDEDLDGLYFY